MTDHSPTPWTSRESCIYDADDKLIALCKKSHPEDNVDTTIIKAVNNHPQLVYTNRRLIEMLEQAIQSAWLYLHEWEDASSGDYPEEHTRLDYMGSALAAAKETEVK